MEKELKAGMELGSEVEFDGMNTAYIVGGALLMATFWASPSMGVLFAIALLVCAAVCAIVLMIACAIGFCDTFASRALKGRGRRQRAHAKIPAHPVVG